MPADSTASHNNSSEPPSKRSTYQSAWPWIMCVVGLDYVSTLGYVPSIAFDVSGRLAPLAMVGVVIVILVLLGFAATDLIFTRTFSAADAAEHVLHTPAAGWQHALDGLSGRWEQGR